jgi:hypothetical protein
VATNVKSGTGSKLYVSSALPATETKAGYTALTWVLVGDTIEIGEYGVEYTIIEHNPIDSAVTQKIKGNASYGSLASKIGSVPADAGQVILLAASTSTNDYAFKIEKTDGDIDAFIGKVTSFKPTVQGNTILSKSVNIVLNSAPINIK